MSEDQRRTLYAQQAVEALQGIEKALVAIAQKLDGIDTKLEKMIEQGA